MVLRLTMVVKTRGGRMQLYIRVYRRNRLVAHFPLTDLKPTKQLSLLESWRASELSKESAAYRAWAYASAPIPSTPLIA